nr:helix-turn-helix domain-containing protein [Bacteroides intestinalis]
MERAAKGIQRLASGYKPLLGGEYYYTDSEVAAKLKVSRRTLQEWRNDGQIAYFLLGGKILYAESDIQKMLEKHYKKPWK